MWPRFTIGMLLWMFVSQSWTSSAEAQNQPFALVEAVQVNDQEAAEGDPPKTPAVLKSYVNAEISFIKRVCDLSDEQLKMVVESAEQAFEEMNDLVAPQNQVIRVAQVHYRGVNGVSFKGDPVKRVRQDAEEYLPLILTEAQHQKYTRESSQRQRAEQEAAADCLVHLVHSKVFLREHQRKKLRDVFLEEWESLDINWVWNYLNNPQFVPIIPSGLLRETLTTEQKAAWSSFQQVSMSVMVSGSQISLDEDWLQ